jgi:hypothetical protein
MAKSLLCLAWDGLKKSYCLLMSVSHLLDDESKWDLLSCWANLPQGSQAISSVRSRKILRMNRFCIPLRQSMTYYFLFALSHLFTVEICGNTSPCLHFAVFQTHFSLLQFVSKPYLKDSVPFQVFIFEWNPISSACLWLMSPRRRDFNIHLQRWRKIHVVQIFS